MSVRLFTTVTFGGFDKEEVLLYIKDLLLAQENELLQYQQQIEILTQQNNSLVEQLQNHHSDQQIFSKLQLQNEKLLQTNQLLKQKLVHREEKIVALQEKVNQISFISEEMRNKMQLAIQETEDRCERQMKEKQLESERKIHDVQLNTQALLEQINTDYCAARNNYSALAKAIHNLSQIIEETDKKTAHQLEILPESILSRGRNE